MSDGKKFMIPMADSWRMYITLMEKFPVVGNMNMTTRETRQNKFATGKMEARSGGVNIHMMTGETRSRRYPIIRMEAYPGGWKMNIMTWTTGSGKSDMTSMAMKPVRQIRNTNMST